ncbi:glycosyltransferase 87 family protein [Methylobacterium segetis]|uniref:glycosyltransferase 87 family protein n=1 Tax=Methylobacterium segetis TaxID=2488750 RepID=UPI001044C254|nr:glycosyltransferase 87 family protein [Methylobacterium segetis]
MSGRLETPPAGLALLGTLLIALTLAALALHVPGADTVGTPLRAQVFVGVLAISVAVYFLAVRRVLRTPCPRAVWFVIAIAVLLRLLLLPSLPFLSSDIYRYVWDGQVQAAGINPYRHVPADPALSFLRDPAVFPLINRADYAHTIYPPAAQLFFAAVGQVTTTVTGMKAAMLLCDGLAIACLLRLLALSGLPRERVLIYAWNPLVLWSFACDGHVDAVAVGLLALALLARARRRDGLAGAFLAAATLVKFLPIVVAPAFLRGGWLWRQVLTGAAVIVALYLPYLSVGTQVLGFLPAYGAEEGFATGQGFWLLAGLSHLVPLPVSAAWGYALSVGIVFSALSLWIATRHPPTGASVPVTLCRDAGILAACATVAASPHYAWYYAWLALPATVSPSPAVIWLSAAPVLFYIDPFNERFAWPSLVFVPALALALRAGLRDQSVPIAVSPRGAS